MLLLTKGNRKLKKGEKLGWEPWGLSLLPHSMVDGLNLCSRSTKPCRDSCIVSVGFGSMPNVENARRVRAELWRDDPSLFLVNLSDDLARLQEKASKGKKISVRLNVFSDVRWEDYLDLTEFPDVQFMDYTKFRPWDRIVPENYDLTYSYRNTKTNKDARETLRILEEGYRLSVVMGSELYAKVTLKGRGNILGTDYTVYDGDAHDLRFLEGPGIVALKAKGKAIGGKFAVH